MKDGEPMDVERFEALIRDCLLRPGGKVVLSICLHDAQFPESPYRTELYDGSLDIVYPEASTQAKAIYRGFVLVFSGEMQLSDEITEVVEKAGDEFIADFDRYRQTMNN